VTIVEHIDYSGNSSQEKSDPGYQDVNLEGPVIEVAQNRPSSALPDEPVQIEQNLAEEDNGRFSLSPPTVQFGSQFYTDQVAEPDQFDSSLDYWVTCIGYCVGFGNVWRFPYLLYSNGGGAFLVPYFLALIAISVPTYALETAYGQLVRKKVNEVFSSVNAGFKGLTYGHMFIAFVATAYYVVLMAWSLVYLTLSFEVPLPWKSTPFGSN